MAQAGKQKLWGGRFTGQTDPLMHEFNQSLTYDKTMYEADILGSKAYALALCKAGILTRQECDTIRRGLDEVCEEWNSGTFKINSLDDEDIHTANERRLTELIGSSIAGKLHTGRSRNDQSATDTRLWLMQKVKQLRRDLVEVIQVMTRRSQEEVDVLMPGYTHLQRAQPIRWSHFLMCHATFFLQDLQRLDNVTPTISVLPLGSGPLAGNPFGIDRELLREELGFASISINSMNGVSDRDYIVEFLFWSTMVMIHMSRCAEDLIIYSSAEFGFVSLSDAYSTGSSIMPQKKNPDSLELLRGKSGRTFGQLSGLMMTYKGLATTYNKDLQEDKEPLFDAVTTLTNSLRIFQGVISTLNVRIHPDKMRAALTPDMLATDLAEYLVRKGVPFRETHHISGSAVRLAEEGKTTLAELTLQQLRGLSDKFEEDVVRVFDFEASVERRDVAGGTSRRSVLAQVASVDAALGEQ